jgi:predicted flap endonuclease-1-like 5' DNA nuclease
MATISDIEGIGPAYAAKLKEAGVRSVEKLLQACATKKQRDKLSESVGITEKLILEWANHADLYRIKGVGSEYSDLLEEAGVDTVPELSNRKPDNLLEKMTEVNAKKKLVRQLPTLKQVAGWVDQAKKLPRILQY